VNQPHPALRHFRSFAAALLLLAGSTGCAFFLSDGPTPDPVLTQKQVDARIDATLDDAIARALPQVSYQSQNPAMTDPLGRTDPSLILRDVETLDGEGRIVCRKQGKNVFGVCAFPPPVSP
jgi:hypothetical protein